MPKTTPISRLLSALVLMLLPISSQGTSARQAGIIGEVEEEHGAEETVAGMLEEPEEATASEAPTQTPEGGDQLTLTVPAAVQVGQSANIKGLVLYQSSTHRYLTIFLGTPTSQELPHRPGRARRSSPHL